MRILVSILDFNSFEPALETISAFRRQRYEDMHLQMIDNASTTDCVRRIRRVFPDLDIVSAPSNLGYTGGNNLALERAKREGFDAVIVCNEDISVEPDAVGFLAETAMANPDAGVVGGIEVDYQTGRVRTTGATEFPDWPLRVRWSIDEAPLGLPWRRVLYVQGALVLFTRRALELGVRFDERLFMYWDEIDLGFALRAAGLAAYVDHRVRFRHHNVPVSYAVHGGYLQQRNRVYLARKYLPSWKRAAFLTYSSFLELPAKFLLRTLQGHGRFARACAMGHFDGLFGRMGKGRLDELRVAR